MYFRIEDKYIIYEDQIAYLKNSLEQVMKRDSNSKDGSYLVRSVYFDDAKSSAYFENLSGVDFRSKFRIRSYNRDSSFLRLEEKIKENGLTHKDSVMIKKETVQDLIKRGNSSFSAPLASASLMKEEDFLFKKLYLGMNVNLLHPVVIVEYEREAFVEANGNVRITFDTNIGAGNEAERFLEDDIRAIPVMERGAHILEVKYDEMLPGYIKKLIDTGSFSRTAFSKYTMAREVMDRNGDNI